METLRSSPVSRSRRRAISCTSSSPTSAVVPRMWSAIVARSSAEASTGGHTYMTIRLVLTARFWPRLARRIESAQEASTVSAVGSDSNRPSFSRSELRSRTCAKATSLSSAGFSFATARNR
ncbi:Uncharacterised protein [Mycobacteroides abscessus subsp. abscessus]|nr:Uncharacterised protein [Mycobacteroides abscessus subsp. abscessus]